MKLVVVIAAYNESETFTQLTIRLIGALDALPDTSWKLVYVIEGTDGTVELARSFALKRPEIEVFYNERPSGLGEAFRRGFAAVPSDTDYVITMDADLNHQPEEIPRLLTVAQDSGAHVVVGSRRVEHSSVEGMPLWKSVLSRSVNRMMHFLTGIRVNDLTSGFRVYRAGCLRQIPFENIGFAFLPELLINAASQQMKIVEEPIRFVFRATGESKMELSATSLSYLRLFLKKLFRAPQLGTRGIQKEVKPAQNDLQD